VTREEVGEVVAAAVLDEDHELVASLAQGIFALSKKHAGLQGITVEKAVRIATAANDHDDFSLSSMTHHVYAALESAQGDTETTWPHTEHLPPPAERRALVKRLVHHMGATERRLSGERPFADDLRAGIALLVELSGSTPVAAGEAGERIRAAEDAADAAERRAAHARRYERDNHHNAAVCPYCTPDPRQREVIFWPDAVDLAAADLYPGEMQAATLRAAVGRAQGLADDAIATAGTGATVDAAALVEALTLREIDAPLWPMTTDGDDGPPLWMGEHESRAPEGGGSLADITRLTPFPGAEPSPADAHPSTADGSTGLSASDRALVWDSARDAILASLRMQGVELDPGYDIDLPVNPHRPAVDGH